MKIDSTLIEKLINNPSESLSVEIKRWINPDEPKGIAKIVKNTLALRNHGGGYLLIGFDDKTLQPDRENVPPDVRALFHLDKIQGLISNYSSEPFEITIGFGVRDGQEHPVIAVPPGIKTPVASKSELRESSKGSKPLIEVDSVYVRSLRANYTPSTTKATWKDWPSIMEICFESREADVGRFLRRHLSGLTPEILKDIATTILSGLEPEPDTEAKLIEFLKIGGERFQAVIDKRGVKMPDHGTWEVALILVGNFPKQSANNDFLKLLFSSNPNYTGWPVWLDSRDFKDEKARPYVFEGAWEALVISELSGFDMDFMRLDPSGRFYLRRYLQDDTSRSPRAPKPMVALDLWLSIIRTTEAIAVGMAFAKAMGCDPEHTLLSFAFRWNKLKGRQLTSWTKPGRVFPPGRLSHQDTVLSFVNVPLEIPLSALAEFVNKVVQPLFEIFDGFQISNDTVEDFSRRLIERKLDF